jgi:hypothetical protein
MLTESLLKTGNMIQASRLAESNTEHSYFDSTYVAQASAHLLNKERRTMHVASVNDDSIHCIFIFFHASIHVVQGDVCANITMGAKGSVELTQLPDHVTVQKDVPVAVRDGTVLRVNVFRCRVPRPKALR